jgi:hypothetical protein
MCATIETTQNPATVETTQNTSQTPPATAALPTMTLEVLEQKQREDPSISAVIEYLQASRKPNTWQRRRENPVTQALLKQWDKLNLHDNILYRTIHLQDEDSSVKQVILPKNLRKVAFQSLHTDMGHLGSDRTLDLTRRHLYTAKNV